MITRNTRPAADRPEESTAKLPDGGVITYRIAALPSFAIEGDDVILSDGFGRAYLLSAPGIEPKPLDPAEADSLGMFFEPSQDSSWHTLPELRRLIFGGEFGSPSA